MNNLTQSNAAWFNDNKVEAALTFKSEQITIKEAKKKMDSLFKKNASFLEESHSLYRAYPTSELYSVITIAENINRELEKIKWNFETDK